MELIKNDSPSASPVLRDTLSYYRFQARIYDSTRWMTLRGRRRFFDALSLQAGDRVLEVGCGTGLNFSHLCRRIGSTGHVTGLDLSPHMLAKASRRIRRMPGHNQVDLVQANAEAFDLGQKFDVVIFTYALSMIPDWESSLHCAGAHLKPAGRVGILDFGTFEGWPNPLARLVLTSLHNHHVYPERSYIKAFKGLCDDVKLEYHARNWYFFAMGATSPRRA